MVPIPEFLKWKAPPLSRWGMRPGGRDYPHVAWRAPDFHQAQRTDGGFKEVIDWIADRHPTVELLAQAHLNLIARRFKQQADKPRGRVGHFALFDWADDCNVANERVATKAGRVQQPPQAGGSPVGWQAHHFAFLVGDDHQWVTVEMDRLDIAADRSLVTGEIAELVGEDLKPSLVRDDNACDHGDHVPFVGGDSNRTARDSSPRQKWQVVVATRALVAKL